MLHTENWTNIHKHVTNRKLRLKFMKTELGKVNELNTKKHLGHIMALSSSNLYLPKNTISQMKSLISITNHR